MLNRDIYLHDPLQSKLANNGVAEVKDDVTQASLDTLHYELKTFVCDGAYHRGLKQILSNFVSNVKVKQEQPGVWISGFFGSGKSHLAKMLRALWTNQRFPDGSDARGIADLPEDISSLLAQLTELGHSHSGLHAASGTLGAAAKDQVRLALLGIIFKSVGLPEQYHLARFVMWLKAQGALAPVQQFIAQHVKAAGGEDVWAKELRNLHVSPFMAKALMQAIPGLAGDEKEVREMLRAQYKIVTDVSNDEMVEAIVDALAVDGAMPLTLIVLDEVQQYIGNDVQRAHDVQEAIETCCKASQFKSRVLFVGTGQSALSGMPNLMRLMGRFQVPVQLEDTDVDSVIRKVILQKKESARLQIQQVVQDNLGEISRHLRGSTIEPNKDDENWMVADYPLLPVRRRFWERVLPALDKTGTGSQLRSQLRLVHEATRETAEKPLGAIVPADFIYEQIATTLLQTGVISKEIYEDISRLKGGNTEQVLQGRILSLILLISKLPSDIDYGIATTADTLTDLLLTDLQHGKHELRVLVPKMLNQLEADGLVMSMQTGSGEEYRLQTIESQQWYDMFRQQEAELRSNPTKLETYRNNEIQGFIKKQAAMVRLTQGSVAEARQLYLEFGSELPADADKKIYAWVPDVTEKAFSDLARGASPEQATIYVFVPTSHRSTLIDAIVTAKAAETTLDVRGVANTDAGKEARAAMEYRLREAERTKKTILSELFSQIQVKLAGGADVAGDSLTEQLQKAAETACLRLYREFAQADHKGWAMVYNRASKEGGENALEALGHHDEADKQPVCALIKRFIGLVKTGAEIREHFSQAPYGWPRDTIDGALYAMLAAGVLKASDAQERAVDAKNLDRNKLTQHKFRPETITVTNVELIKVRSLINSISDLNCTAKEEVSKLPLALQQLKQLARTAGGDAPLPPPPQLPVLHELEVLSGNAQLKAAFEQRDAIEAAAEAWRNQALLVKERRARWDDLQLAMTYCKDLHVYESLHTEQQAIMHNRSLLAQPDPVEPLLKKAIVALRDLITAHIGRYESEYHTCMRALEQDPDWQRLTSDRQQVLLQQANLAAMPKVDLSGQPAVLDAISETPIQTWNDRIAALPGRFEQVRKKAVTEMQPKVTHLSIKKPVIKNEAELTAWLQEIEQQIKAELVKGPVAPN